MPSSKSISNHLQKKIQIHITTGDVDGIGLEVTLKSIRQWEHKDNDLSLISPFEIQLLVWIHSDSLKEISTLYPFHKHISGTNVSEILSDEVAPVLFVVSDEPPAQWVENAARECMEAPQTRALVTAPLSKLTMKNSGFSDLGHTPLLARISGSGHLRMGFVGGHFSVLLHSDHIPLSRVASTVNVLEIEHTVRAAQEMRSVLGSTLPIGWLGVNPHSGEGGLIGEEDSKLSEILKRYPEIKNSLVPDATFHKEKVSQFSLIVANYHDQGLIPFKLVHGFDDGVHMTLNLPFVRTSVDHGTAKDIFGQNKANHRSMFRSIVFACRLLKVRNQNA